MPQTSGLTIRQHERRNIDLEADFLVAEEHHHQVRFSPRSSALGPHLVRGRANDISPGGMGLTLRQFIPRMCEGKVRVYSAVPVDAAHDGTPLFEAIFEHRVKVRRVYMSSHEPTYSVGVSFVDAEDDLDLRVRAILTLAAGTVPVAEQGEGGRGA